MNFAWLWVGLLYGGATWLGRRGGATIPWRVAALFYLLVLIFLFRPMMGPWVNVATDVLHLLPPWSATAPEGLSKYTVTNLQQGDVPMQLVPWAHQVREAWRSGRVPVWNELTGTGFPLISNGQGGALSPLRLLALPLPLAQAIVAEAAFKLLVSLTFTFLLARRLQMSVIASLIAAVSYGLGPFLIVWLHFAQGTVASFLPAVIYCITVLAERYSLGRLTAMAATVPLVLFSGHPDTASHIALFAGAYALWITAVERPAQWPRRLGSIVAAGTIGVLLSLPFIVPFLEALPHGFRYATIEQEPRRQVPYSDFPSLVLLAQPRIFGTLPQSEVWGPAHAESITGFAGILGIAGFFVLLADVVASRRYRRREVFFLVAAAAIFAILANWRPATAAIHALLPLGSHARMRFLFAFTLAIAAGFLVDRLRGDARARGLAALAAAAATAVWIIGQLDFPTTEWRNVALRAFAWSAVVLLAAAAIAVRRAQTIAGFGVLALVVIELWLVTGRWNPVRPIATFYPRTPLIDAVTRVHRPGRDRAVGIGPVLFPNTNLIFGIEDVRVLDAMAPLRYMSLLNRISPAYDLRDYYVKWEDADNPLLDYLNVRWVMVEADRDLVNRERFRELYAGNDGRLFENRNVLPRFFPVRDVVVQPNPQRFDEQIRAHREWRTVALVRSLPVRDGSVRAELLTPRALDAPEADVQITGAEATAYDLRVDAPRHTLVVSSVGWWRWWRADIDGRRLRTFPVNDAFLGFVVPPGAGTVHVRYVPLSLYAASAVSLLTICGVAAVAVVRRSRRRQHAG